MCRNRLRMAGAIIAKETDENDSEIYLSQIGLSLRTLNTLEEAGICTVREFRAVTVKELM